MTTKAEIEAFIDHQARKLGMTQLQGAPTLLLSGRAEKVVNALPERPEGD